MTLTEQRLARALAARADWIDLPDDFLTRIKERASGATRRRSARPWLLLAAAALLLLLPAGARLRATSAAAPGHVPAAAGTKLPVGIHVREGAVPADITLRFAAEVRRQAPFFDLTSPAGWSLSYTHSAVRVDSDISNELRLPLIRAEYNHPTTNQAVAVDQWVSPADAPLYISLGTTETKVNGYRTLLIKDLVFDKDGKTLPTFSPRVQVIVPLPADRMLRADFRPQEGQAALTMDDLVAFATTYTQHPPAQLK